MSISRTKNVNSRAGLLLAVPMIALALSGCKTTGSTPGTLLGDPASVGSTPKVHNPTANETAKWAKRWKAKPGDVSTTMNYVARLRAIGSNDRAVSVLNDALKANPGSTLLRGELGKQLASMGEFQKASVVLQQAAARPDATWQIHSAKGVVLDHLGRHGDAQTAYKAALKKSPGQITALNNLGLSQAQAGDLKGAEKTLREAYGTPTGREHSRLRQNLALVLGLQGRFDEAKTIVAADLPPQQVEQNMAYLRKMLSQPNPWKKLSQMDKKKT
ncbi:MAG: tetratricopeptide repeat protein [Pseudomonadota bacterium]